MTPGAVSRRHLRRGLQEPLRGDPHHGPRSHLARSCAPRGHRQRVFHHHVRLRGGSRSLRRPWRRQRLSPTPDGRPGAIVQFHVPRFRKDRVDALERALLVRISQNVLTCPTAACFNLLDTDPVLQAGPEDRLFRRRLPVPGHALRPAGVGRADSRRRVHHRPPLRLSRRADGRQSVAVRQGPRFGARRGRAVRGRHRADTRRHHAVPGWRRRQRIESRAAGIPSRSPAPTNNSVRRCATGQVSNRNCPMTCMP